jgi:type IV secretory pathway VirB10-like protein
MSDNNSDDHMAPDASPGQQARRPGVRRVNNMPIYLMVGALGTFLIIMVLVASDRAAKQAQPAQGIKEGAAGNSNAIAKVIAGDRKDGIVPAKSVAPPAVPSLAAPDTIAIARPANLDEPPMPPGAPTPPNSLQQAQYQQALGARDDERDRMRIMKLQQFDEAVKAKTSLAVGAPRSAASSPASTPLGAGGTPARRDEVLAGLAAVRQQIEASTRDDPTAAYKARLQQLQGAGVGIASADEGQGAGASKVMQDATARNDVSQFAGQGQRDRWGLDSKPEQPRTPYELRAGYVVPATLISGINSQLPGQIVAQVSQDVYDTPVGKYKLIPQGSRLVGSYSNDVAYGQSRLFVAWQRIIFPDGKAMDIGAMPGADGAGYAGFNDQVNNHYLRTFGSAFLMSGVTAGVALSQPDTLNANGRPTASSAMSEALGQQLGQVTAQMIAKNLNIAPSLEIRPGFRFNVIVIKDLTFSKPYAAFDY